MLDRNTCRVILIEDSPADARLVREALGEHDSVRFEIVHCLRLELALEFLTQTSMDVALLDYRLPDVEDLEGLKRIVALAPNLPVIILTGLEDGGIGVRSTQHGAQDYVVKGSQDGAGLARTIRQAIERKELSDKVRDSEERFSLAAAGSGDGIWDWDIRNNRVFLSARAQTILGLEPGTGNSDMEAIARRIHVDDLSRIRYALTTYLSRRTPVYREQARVQEPNGQSRWILIRGMAVFEADGRARRMAGSYTDLANLDAYYDIVTGLPTRALVIDRLHGIVKARQRHSDARAALLMLSLSRYSQLGETLGHGADDAVMIAAARAIESAVRPGDMVGRISANEMAVVMDVIADADEATVVAGRICRALLAPILIEGHAVVPTIRMGIVVMTSAYSDAEAVMRDAAAALVSTAAGSELPYRIFNPEMRDRANARLRIEMALRHAIEREALRLVYQPIVALESADLRGFEALLRWEDPEIGQISPGIFIPIAEETGLIEEIGDWVLREACCRIADWRDRGLISCAVPFTVSVNLSGRQIEGLGSIERILHVIEETGVSPQHLTMELTETALSDEPNRARDALLALRAHGVSLAMDDFGTGYSSLSYLARFPFDKLKIDQSFVATIADGIAPPLLKAMIGLTRELGLRTVAEGVETEEQRDVLRALGCEDAQGWLFGRPLEIDAAETLLQSSIHAQAQPEMKRRG